MSKERTPYNPTPGDYDVEKLSGTRPKSSNRQEGRDNIAPTRSLDPLSTDGPNKNITSSTSSKPHPVTGPVAMNHEDAFEYENHNILRS